MTIDSATSAIERRRQAEATARIIVTGFSIQPSHSHTLFCDTEAEAEYLRELLFRCGCDAAEWRPNPHVS